MRDTGCTFVYVTHDQMEAMTLATSICLIENGIMLFSRRSGRLIETGSLKL